VVAAEQERGMTRKVLSAELKSAIWEKSQGRCWYCGKQCNPFTDMHIDHIRARAKGGSDDIDNLVIACVACNIEKRDLYVYEFRRKHFAHINWPRTFWNETDAGLAVINRERNAIVTMMGVRVA
jgi:5-methylcytosine-specific restriction endonuclease McrA